jgi:adenylate cyclase
MASVNAEPESDGVFRSLPLWHEDPIYGDFLPSLALAAVLSATGSNASLDDRGAGVLCVGDHGTPLVRGRPSAFLRFYGPGDVGADGRGRTFRYVSMGEIMRRAAQAMMAGKKPPYADPDLSGKIVLVGANVAGLYDLKATPVSSVYPGVELHATLITNILKGEHVRGPFPSQALGLALVCALAVGMVVVAAYRPVLTVPVTALVAAGVGVISYQAYARGGLFLHATPAWAATAATFVCGTLYNFATEGRRRRRIKGMFQTYVSPEVVDQMIARPELYALGGERKPMTVLFSDIRGFTTLSEGLEPTEVVALLNTYLDPMTEIVIRHRGTLDKYIGDAVVAIYGAPLPMEDHAARACRSALEMFRALEETVNPELVRRGWPEVRIGVGINSGLICAGNMGSERRRDYTVIGDGVNLASRLEGLNKYYGTRILIGPETREQVGDAFVCRHLDRVAVKGRGKAVDVHELVGEAVGEAEREAIRVYEEGLALLWARRFEEAAARFGEALGARPEDTAAGLMKKRAVGFAAEPPPEDWSGAHVMDAK